MDYDDKFAKGKTVPLWLFFFYAGCVITVATLFATSVVIGAYLAH